MARKGGLDGGNEDGSGVVGVQEGWTFGFVVGMGVVDIGGGSVAIGGVSACGCSCGCECKEVDGWVSESSEGSSGTGGAFGVRAASFF